MEFTVVIPFYNGAPFLRRTLAGIPANVPVVIVDDHSDVPLQTPRRPKTYVIRPAEKGYFAGAVNAGLDYVHASALPKDVLILNQDVELNGTLWLDVLRRNRAQYGLIGERIRGHNPAWPYGYVQGTFMFIRADAWPATGPLNTADFPLWGATAEWQLRAARRGFAVLPLVHIPGFVHDRPGRHGAAIKQVLKQEPERYSLMVRTPPLVSVVVPCYNAGRYLPDLLASLIGGPSSLGDLPGQDWQAFEVIFVNDGSTDDSLEIMQRLANDWQGVRVVTRPNGGTPAANNTGIRAAQAPIITIMGADDMRAPDSLGRLYRAQIANPHSLIYDNLRVMTKGELGEVMPLQEYDFDKLIYKNQVPAGIMFPKKAWVEVGGYAEAMRYGREDWAFAVALGLAGYCGVRVENAGYYYRREGQNRSLTNTTPGWRAHFLAQIQELYPQAYNGARPMACCGGRRATPASAATGGTAKAAGLIGAAGFVTMEYIGKNYANVVLYGAVTGAQYKFSASKKRFYVDARDAPYLRDWLEDKRKVLRIVPQPVATAAAPAAQPVADVTLTPPTEKELVPDGVQNEEEEAGEPEVKVIKRRGRPRKADAGA